MTKVIFKVKKVFTSIMMAFSVLSMNAEGYQINTLSARQNGMGHTGVAQKLGSESMIFNPAGLAFLDRTIDFRGSVTGIFAHASADYKGTTYYTDNTPSTPLSFNLGMSIYDNLKAGVSFYTPYGSGINWGDNWPGAVLSQKVNLKVFTIQPTIAWRVLPNFSVGAGAMISFGDVDLDKGLVPVESANAILASLGQEYRFKDTPASINLKGKSSTTVGVNVGAMWDINSKVTVGASFRSKMTLRVKMGEASVRYGNEVARRLLEDRLGILDAANFSASMPAAAVLNFGVAYRPLDKLLLAADMQWTGWSAYKSLDIHFLSEQLAAFDQHLVKDYRNSWTYKLGAQYTITKRFDVRAGLMVDTTPVRRNRYNPETPGMTKISPSVGFSFSPVSSFSIDASLLYVAGLGRDGASCEYADLLLGKTSTFTADYKVHAWNPSIGFSYKF